MDVDAPIWIGINLVLICENDSGVRVIVGLRELSTVVACPFQDKVCFVSLNLSEPVVCDEIADLRNLDSLCVSLEIPGEEVIDRSSYSENFRIDSSKIDVLVVDDGPHAASSQFSDVAVKDSRGEKLAFAVKRFLNPLRWITTN